MTSPTFTLGISPCPNDTFIFEALLHDRFSKPFAAEPHIADVEELNQLAVQGVLHISKLSLAAVVSVLDKYILLNSGAALGRGCGPLVVARPGLDSQAIATAPIAVPGKMTTANLLLSLCGKCNGVRQEMVFDEIIPALCNGTIDLGVIIHEGRFTYQDHGLELVLDLGQWWEEHTSHPLPLGVIAVRRDIDTSVALDIQAAIKRSVEYAWEHPGVGQEFIRSHAQEMDPKVMSSHIATFVNEYSRDLGEEGQKAIRELLEAALKGTGRKLPGNQLFL